MPSQHHTLRTILRAAAALIGGAVALFAVLGLLPRRDDLASRAAPADDYAAALARLAQVRAAEAGRVNELGGSLLLEQGGRTARAYVLVHGVTNSPYQWAELGRSLHALGHNVLILRMPCHGLQSHDVRELAALAPQDLRAYGDTAVDIAAGLGDEVVVAGISGGGAVAAWMAQNRPEVDRAVLLAPFFGVHYLPPALSALLGKAFGRLPNIVLKRPGEQARSWVYRGEATRGVAAFLILGQEVLRQARAGQVPGGAAGVVTTAADDTASNAATAVLVALWRQGGTGVQQVEFPAAAAVPHNSVDPAADPAAKAQVYAALLRLFGEDPGALPAP